MFSRIYLNSSKVNNEQKNNSRNILPTATNHQGDEGEVGIYGFYFVNFLRLKASQGHSAWVGQPYKCVNKQ